MTLIFAGFFLGTLCPEVSQADENLPSTPGDAGSGTPGKSRPADLFGMNLDELMKVEVPMV